MKTLYAEVARLHRGAISRGFLSSLGDGFLVHLYRAIDATAGGVLVTEIRDGRVIGFAAGATSVSDVYRTLAKNRWRVALSLIPALSPAVLLKLAETWRYGKGRKATSANVPNAELLSIAVAPEYRGQGVADRLFVELSSRFRDLGVSDFRIVVGSELVGAHKFYTRMGAIPMSVTEVHRGERSVIYRYQMMGDGDDSRRLVARANKGSRIICTGVLDE